MNTISRQFYETSKRLPNKVAVIQGSRQLTYAGLLALVQQQALVLRLNDLERGDHVLCQLTGIDFVVLLLACADAGICLVPMSKDAVRDTIAKAYAVCDCKAFIVSPCAEDAGHGNSAKLKFAGRPSDNFLIITTSGSTGEPKPILLKQDTKLSRVEMMNELYHCAEGDVTLISTPLCHSMGQRLVLMSVLKGGTLVLMDGWSAEKWAELVNEHGVTFAVPVASQVKQIMDWDEYTPSMRCMVSSSALLTANDVGSAQRGYPLFNCYGTTEVSIATSTDSTTPEGSVGKPIAGVQVWTEESEVCVKSPLAFDCYYKTPSLDFLYFKTGDLGHMDKDGNLFYLGRIKELINVGGTKVYPQDVEAVLASYPAIAECAAFPQHDDALGEVVALAVVLDQERVKANVVGWETFDWLRGIQGICLPHLTDAQLPRAVHIVDALPKTDTGKIQRGKLVKKFGGVE